MGAAEVGRPREPARVPDVVGVAAGAREEEEEEEEEERACAGGSETAGPAVAGGRGGIGQHRHVCVGGGAFDDLHGGHEVLLAIAAILIAHTRTTCGVSSGPLVL